MTDNMPPRIYLNTQGELFNASRDGFTRYATEYTRTDLVKPLLDALDKVNNLLRAVEGKNEFETDRVNEVEDIIDATLQQYNEVMR